MEGTPISAPTSVQYQCGGNNKLKYDSHLSLSFSLSLFHFHFHFFLYFLSYHFLHYFFSLTLHLLSLRSTEWYQAK